MEKAYEASAIAAKERLNCIAAKQSFSFETVMSHPDIILLFWKPQQKLVLKLKLYLSLLKTQI